jgi:ribonuclease BN (tRNA processing enzyme)
MKIFFLGTGGGRFATITQRPKTGGIRIIADKLNAHLDPGPGALIYSHNAGLDPTKLNLIAVSHSHPDHYNDAEVMIEAMTVGSTKRKGTLLCSPSVTLGNDVCSPAISKYHKSLPAEVVEIREGESRKLDCLDVVAMKTIHSDPETVGFKFTLPTGETIGYTSDTQYFEGVAKECAGVDLLIICNLRPGNNRIKWHLCTDDVVKIVRELRPKRAVLTHFGMRMIKVTDPKLEAKHVEQETGIPTIAAEDGMKLEVKKENEKLTKFLSEGS